jgi:hypothetical protein
MPWTTRDSQTNLQAPMITAQTQSPRVQKYVLLNISTYITMTVSERAIKKACTCQICSQVSKRMINNPSSNIAEHYSIML